MLRDRLGQIKPLLAEDGSVWVHLDHVESHRCRSVLDEELGPENFVAEIAWQKATAPKSDTKGISISQDVILVYRKSAAWRPNRMFRLASTTTTRYKSRDGDRIPWRDDNATANGAVTHQSMVYGIQHPVTGNLVYPTAGRHWAKEQAWMLEQLSEYAPYELRDINDTEIRAQLCGLTPGGVRTGVPAIMLAVPLEEAAELAKRRYEQGDWPELVMLGMREKFQRKKHLVDNGRVPESLWLATEVGGSIRGKNEIKAMFPDMHPFATPKPEQLLQRIIHIGSNPGDIVLDCYAGSGTTAAVAHKMGRRWVTSELIADTMSRFTLPRLIRVLEGDEMGGISTTTKRVAETALPAGVKPDDAFRFQQLLRKVLATADDAAEPDEDADDEDELDERDEDTPQAAAPAPPALDLDKALATIVRRLARNGDSPLNRDENRTLLVLLRKLEGLASLDLTAQVKSNLNTRTKTQESTTRHWFGGGAFTHVKVGPSMFVEVAGMLLLADWATQSELSKVICAQLSVRYAPDGIFAGREGRTRYVVIDGMVGEGTVEAVVDRLAEGEVVEVWATQVEAGAGDVLRKLRPGSTLHPIPAAVLDSYRRKKNVASPFRKPQTTEPDQATTATQGVDA